MKAFSHVLQNAFIFIILFLCALISNFLLDPILYAIGIPIRSIRPQIPQPIPFESSLFTAYLIVSIIVFLITIFFSVVVMKKSFPFATTIAFVMTFISTIIYLLCYSWFVFPLNTNAQGYDACMKIRDQILSSKTIDDHSFYIDDPSNLTYGEFGSLEDFIRKYGKYNFKNTDHETEIRYSFARVESVRDLRKTYCDLVVKNGNIISAGNFTIRFW